MWRMSPPGPQVKPPARETAESCESLCVYGEHRDDTKKFRILCINLALLSCHPFFLQLGQPMRVVNDLTLHNKPASLYSVPGLSEGSGIMTEALSEMLVPGCRGGG